MYVFQLLPDKFVYIRDPIATKFSHTNKLHIFKLCKWGQHHVTVVTKWMQFIC